MKRTAVFAAVLVLLISLCGCAEKTKPALDIKSESVTSIEFKRTCYSDDDPSFRSYVSKTVSQREDIDEVINWAKSLKLSKQSAIEIPVEKVEYVIVLNGVKKHKLIFMGDYIVLDAAAYTFDNPAQKTQVREKYNMLNYSENSAELDLM